MLYKKLAEVYESLSGTTKRLEKTSILSKFIELLHEDDKETLYLLLGDIYPEWSEKKIGISEKLAIKALSKTTGESSENITKEWKKLGDLGLVSEKFTSKKKQATLHSHTLTTRKVIENLRKLPELEGKGTVDKKLSLITELLTSASGIEAKYLVRTLIGDLRIGIKENTVRDSLAKAFLKEPSKEDIEKIEDAINQSNDVAIVFEALKKHGLLGLKKISFEVGKPMKAMLAQKAKTVEDGFKQLGVEKAFIEYKYDGFRMIIHKSEKGVKLFTRRLEEVTKQFPEVAEYINKYVKGKVFVLDSEAVGFHKVTKKYQPFQAISQRIRRKYDIEEMQKTLPIELNVFDVLYHNGKNLINEPLEKRRKLLEKIITEKRYKIVLSKLIISSDVEKTKAFYKAALKDNQEGIMMKNPGAGYKPGSRVGHMLKIKPEERELDLVITGAEAGKGKRAGWYSSFILSCYNKKTKEFLEIGKMSTGLKEKDEEGVSFNEISKLIKPHITKEHGRLAEVKPKIVLSITYQELQRSPNYKSGFALRFPRFTALRPDRKAEDVATLEEIKTDYERQQGKWKYG